MPESFNIPSVTVVGVIACLIGIASLAWVAICLLAHATDSDEPRHRQGLDAETLRRILR